MVYLISLKDIDVLTDSAGLVQSKAVVITGCGSIT